MNVVNSAMHSRRLRRREVLAGALTLAAVLGGCARDAVRRPSVDSERDVDVAVIGAGIAGLAAVYPGRFRPPVAA